MGRREDSHAEIVRLLEAAHHEAASTWCDLVCQDVTRRLGWTGDGGPIDDPEYGAALAAYALIGDCLDTLRRTGA